MCHFQSDLEPLVMVSHLCLGVIILSVTAAVVANPDINVECLKDTVNITWKITPELVPYASRLFLGNCMPSLFSVEKGGGGEATFKYKLSDCRFKIQNKGKYIIYQNNLTFRPEAKTKAAASYTYPIECVYKRPDKWIPSFLIRGTGSTEGHGGLVFHMALLNEQMTGIAKTNVIPLGSFIPIWAAVEQKAHQPLLLLIDECVAATTPELQPDSRVYPIVTNKGCLVDGKRGNSRFLRHYHSSAIILHLQSFKFPLAEEVYIHCKLVAWDPEVLNEGRKACHYIAETSSWELLDDPFQNDLCSCCDSSCKSRSKRGVGSDSQGLVQKSVFGPLIIVDRLHARSHNRTGATPVKLLITKKDSKLAVGSSMDPALDSKGGSD